jgi:hypothetical protein
MGRTPGSFQGCILINGIRTQSRPPGCRSLVAAWHPDSVSMGLFLRVRPCTAMIQPGDDGRVAPSTTIPNVNITLSCLKLGHIYSHKTVLKYRIISPCFNDESVPPQWFVQVTSLRSLSYIQRSGSDSSFPSVPQKRGSYRWAATSNATRLYFHFCIAFTYMKATKHPSDNRDRQ